MMQNAGLIRMIELKYGALSPVLDERQRRQWAAAEALAYGWVARYDPQRDHGIGSAEVESEAPIDARLREPGGGPKRLIDGVR